MSDELHDDITRLLKRHAEVLAPAFERAEWSTPGDGVAYLMDGDTCIMAMSEADLDRLQVDMMPTKAPGAPATATDGGGTMSDQGDAAKSNDGASVLK